MVCMDLVWITVSLCLLAPPLHDGRGRPCGRGCHTVACWPENNSWSLDSADVEIICSSWPLPFVLSSVTPGRLASG